MASYLVIKNESSINRYLCKTTHDSIPYIKISTNDTGGYLDLTTASTTGMRLNLSNVTESGTLTSSSSSQYDETTGYSGVSSKESTSGYTGVSSKSSTSGYTGYLSRSSTSGYTGKAKSTWNNLPASQTGASNKLTRTTSSNYSFKSFEYAITINVRTTVSMFSSAYRRYGDVLHLVTSRTSTTDANNMDGKLNIAFAVVDSQLNDTRKLVGGPPFQQIGRTMHTEIIIASHDFKHDSAASGTLSVKMNSLIRGKQTITRSIATYFNIASITLQENVQPCYSGYSSSSNTVYSSSVTTNAALSSTTALTRSSAYLTSSEVIGNLSSTTALTRSSSYSSSSVDVGNLSSTTALTRSSSYNTSSSTTNAGISSTTALITTSSRSEEYETETHYTTHYRPCNTKSITVPKTISLESSYYTGVKSVGGAGTLTITRSSQYDETIGYSGVESKSSTSGYTGISSSTSEATMTTGYSGVSRYSGTGDLYYLSGSYTSQLNGSILYGTKIRNKFIGTATFTYADLALEDHTGTITSPDPNKIQTMFSSQPDNYIVIDSIYNSNYISSSTSSIDTIEDFWTSSITHTNYSWTGSTQQVDFNNGRFTEKHTYRGTRIDYGIYKIKNVTDGWYKWIDIDHRGEYASIKITTPEYTSSIDSTYLSEGIVTRTLTSITKLTKTQEISKTYSSSSIDQGNLSSTTALTRSSSYNTSSSTTNEILSSTTALTTTSSRSSEYTIAPGGTYTMTSRTTNLKMSSIGFETRQSTSYTTSVNAIADEED